MIERFNPVPVGGILCTGIVNGVVYYGMLPPEVPYLDSTRIPKKHFLRRYDWISGESWYIYIYIYVQKKLSCSCGVLRIAKRFLSRFISTCSNKNPSDPWVEHLETHLYHTPKQGFLLPNRCFSTYTVPDYIPKNKHNSKIYENGNDFNIFFFGDEIFAKK